MSEVKFFKVTELPVTLEPNSFYFIPHTTENWAEGYLTDNLGIAHSLGNEQMIADIAAEQIGPGKLTVLQDVAARDALGLTQIDDARLVLVADATSDIAVTTGGALYAWNPDEGATGAWVLMIAYSDMTYDFSTVDINWSQLISGPTSAVGDIDDAVTKRHEHTNIAVLNDLGDDGTDNLTYKGVSILAKIEWATVNW